MLALQSSRRNVLATTSAGLPTIASISSPIIVRRVISATNRFKKIQWQPFGVSFFSLDFETHIESRINDRGMLFCLLLQHCEEKVKPKINHDVGKDEMA